MNNPLAATDPTGYQIECFIGQSCNIQNEMNDLQNKPDSIHKKFALDAKGNGSKGQESKTQSAKHEKDGTPILDVVNVYPSQTQLDQAAATKHFANEGKTMISLFGGPIGVVQDAIIDLTEDTKAAVHTRVKNAIQNAVINKATAGLAKPVQKMLPQIRKATKGNVTGTPLKRGPKTDPDAPHNAKNREVGDSVAVDGTLIAGGGRLPERLIPTPGGIKSGRRPDTLYRDSDGIMRGVNSGKTKADGTPIKREQEALDDLNGAGLPTTFKPYDRN